MSGNQVFISCFKAEIYSPGSKNVSFNYISQNQSSMTKFKDYFKGDKRIFWLNINALELVKAQL